MKNSNVTMKSFFWMVGGICAAAAGFLVWSPYKTRPVDDLAHSLQDTWNDHRAD